jgi:hypothetical protein
MLAILLAAALKKNTAQQRRQQQQTSLKTVHHLELWQQSDFSSKPRSEYYLLDKSNGGRNLPCSRQKISAAKTAKTSRGNAVNFSATAIALPALAVLC